MVEEAPEKREVDDEEDLFWADDDDGVEVDVNDELELELLVAGQDGPIQPIGIKEI